MAQRGGTKVISGRGISRRKVAVSFILRDKLEKLNRSGVNKLRIDPTNHLLYTAGRDSVIRSWDIENADKKDIQYVKSMEHHTDWINDIVLCMNGRYIMSASSDTSLKVWDTSRGSCSSTLRTHKDYVRCLAYAKEKEMVASGGLDKAIFLWDVKTLTSLTATNSTVTTSSFTGHKESVYSIDMNPDATIIISGSTEKLLRVWDPRTCEPLMKLKGHTDNIRTVKLNRDGTLVLSGSSDGTIRLWSLGQQRCIETFRVHDEGVWSLEVDEEFRTVYSSGRDRRVCATELTQNGQEGVLLFTEEHPVLDLALDDSGSCDSLWVATTETHVNKWSIDPHKANGFGEEDTGLSGDEEEEVGITDIDEHTPYFTKPIATIPGGCSLKEFSILGNRQQVLTRDSRDHVVLWDVLHACKEEDLGKVDMKEVAAARKGNLYIPNWFSPEIKTGMLTIRLEETDCFSAWVMGSNTILDTAAPDIKLNLGALMLLALFEHWPSAKSPEPTNTSKVASITPPSPSMELLVELCGGENLRCELWEDLGIALRLSELMLENICKEEGSDLEKRKQCVLNIWVNNNKDVSWEVLVNALNQMKETRLAYEISEKYCLPPFELNEANSKVEVKFFSVSTHTPVILSEVGDCGTTMTRMQSGDMAGSHETRQLNTYAPIWVMDTVCQKKLPDSIKLNFFLGDSLDTRSDRLSAQDLLTIRKVRQYVHDRITEDKDVEPVSMEDRGSNISITCADQILDPELDLRSVKYSVWRSGGDMKLIYKVNKVEPTKSGDQAEASPSPNVGVVEDMSGDGNSSLGNVSSSHGNVEDLEKAVAESDRRASDDKEELMS